MRRPFYSLPPADRSRQERGLHLAHTYLDTYQSQITTLQLRYTFLAGGYTIALAIEDPNYHISWLDAQNAQFNPPTS